MLSSLAPARRRLVLILAAVVALAVVVAVAGLAIGRGSSSGGGSTAQPVAQAVAGPVLLLPGYGGSTSGLATLATRLRSAGKDVTVVSLPDNAEGDLAAQAKVVSTAVDGALTRTGAASVDIVGYSAGGVVARIYAAQDGGAAKVRRIVTLGSPQHGTALASLGSLIAGECPVACQQLIPTSAVLAKLNVKLASGNEVPVGPRWVSLWSDKDQVVVPPQSAELVGALNIEIQSVCASSVVSHTDLPTDQLVGGMVAAELASGDPVPLTAADCARLS